MITSFNFLLHFYLSQCYPGLPLRRLHATKQVYKLNHTCRVGLMRATSGRMTPQLMVASLPSAPSPAMFPSTITAWFTILMSVEERSWTNIGTALASTTALVWWDEPEAMLANTHATSNCSLGLRREGGDSRRQDRRGSCIHVCVCVCVCVCLCVIPFSCTNWLEYVNFKERGVCRQIFVRSD